MLLVKPVKESFVVDLVFLIISPTNEDSPKISSNNTFKVANSFSSIETLIFPVSVSSFLANNNLDT